MRLRSTPEPVAYVPTAAEKHQAAILAEFQRASAACDRSADLLETACRMNNEAEAVYEVARKALRRVAEGAI